MLYVGICEGGDNLCLGIKLKNKLKHTLGCNMAQLGVEHLLISLRSVGTEAETSCGLTNRNAVKGSRLKKERRGIIVNLGCIATHNTCDSNGLVAGGDHKHILVNISLYTVKGGELKTLGEGLYLNLINLCVIEGMHGLAKLHHNVVGKVGEEVDCTAATVEETDSHVNRANLTSNVLNLDCGVTVAKLGCLHVNEDGRKVIELLGVNECRALKLSACNGSELTSDTVVAPEVRTVGKRLVINLEDNIVDVVNFLNVGTESDIVGNLPKTAVVIRNAKLALGAAHTVGHVAANLSGSDGDITDLAANSCKGYLHSLSYVRCATYDVKHLVTLINLKKVKLLGIGVVLNRENLRNNNSTELVALFNNILNLCCGEGEVLNKRLFVKTRKVNKIANPIH